MNKYWNIKFIKSAAKLTQMPADSGFEVAFVGRSNSGKSSALNTLTGSKKLAKVSKTPGRTRLINIFGFEDTNKRLIDLPGYGYAKVSQKMQAEWEENLAEYFYKRKSLKGIVILMDIRHPLKDSDKVMLDFAMHNNLPAHILLTKQDKLSKNQQLATLQKLKNMYKDTNVSVQLFSSLKKQGIDELTRVLDDWLQLDAEV